MEATNKLERIQARLRVLYVLQDVLIHSLIWFFEELVRDGQAEELDEAEEGGPIEDQKFIPYYEDSELAPIAPLEGAERYLCRELGRTPLRLVLLRERIGELEELERKAWSGDAELGAKAFALWAEQERLVGQAEELIEEYRAVGLTIN